MRPVFRLVVFRETEPLFGLRDLAGGQEGAHNRQEDDASTENHPAPEPRTGRPNGADFA